MKRSLAAAPALARRLSATRALACVELSLGLAAVLDHLGELALFGSGEEGHFADLVEVGADCISHVEVSNR